MALLGGVTFWSRYCLVRGSASLGAGFEVSDAQVMPSGGILLLPADQNEELAAPSPVPRLPAHCHTPVHGDNGLTLIRKPALVSF